MSDVKIKVGMLVSFDYQYIYNSLPRIYEHADTITLAVDHEYRTWAGIKFEIDDKFWNWIKEIDIKNKITIYKDDFFDASLDALANDSRERNMLAQKMGEGGWIVQIDSDEYFLDFKQFVDFLKSKAQWTLPGAKPIDIGAFLIPLFKQTEDGFLYIKDSFETVVLATNKPEYQRARRCNHYIRYTPFYLFHQTWARGEEEIWFKLNSWGHMADFNITSYYNLWKATDKNNHKFIKNFHPLYNNLWQELRWSAGNNIAEFIVNYLKEFPVTVPKKFYLKKRMGQVWRVVSGDTKR